MQPGLKSPFFTDDYFEIFDDAESAIQREKRFEKVESSLENPIH